MPSLKKLTVVFDEARALVARPDNDFTWSSWIDADQATAEIDGLLSQLRSGMLPNESTMHVLFAPTGPMQEVAEGSGWGNEFIELANRFDAAMATDDLLDPLFPCSCLEAPSRELDLVRDLGMDSRLAEASLLRCPRCGQLWLRYFYEVEGISESGRWYLGPVSSEAIGAADTKDVLEGLEWYFYGGSYYDGRSGKTTGPITV